MPQSENTNRIMAQIHELMQELTTQEAIDHDAEPGVLTCCVVLTETMIFDSDGEQRYRPDWFATRVGSLAQTLGLISAADKIIAHNLTCHGPDE